MKMNELLNELRVTEHMDEEDVRRLAEDDPEKLWRIFLRVKGTLEPDPECIRMRKEMENDIARMRENMTEMAADYAMMDFHEPGATVRSIMRALDDRDADIDDIYEEEREEDDEEDDEE